MTHQRHPLINKAFGGRLPVPLRNKNNHTNTNSFCCGLVRFEDITHRLSSHNCQSYYQTYLKTRRDLSFTCGQKKAKMEQERFENDYITKPLVATTKQVFNRRETTIIQTDTLCKITGVIKSIIFLIKIFEKVYLDGTSVNFFIEKGSYFWLRIRYPKQ